MRVLVAFCAFCAVLCFTLQFNEIIDTLQAEPARVLLSRPDEITVAPVPLEVIHRGEPVSVYRLRVDDQQYIIVIGPDNMEVVEHFAESGDAI